MRPCVSACAKQGRRKDGGQQGQTRQPLRSHQVCRDTLEHSEPDGICPPGVRSRPDDIQAQGQARKEGRKEGRMEDGASCLSCTICPNNSRAITNGNSDCIMHQLRATTIPPQTCDVHGCSTLVTCVRAQGSSGKHVASIPHQITYILNNMAHMLMRDVTPSRL